MISKLPKWAWYGSALLTFLAGMANAIGFLGFQHQGITHLTGNTTLLGIAIAKADARQAGHLAAIILSFVLGCVASGALIQDSALKLGRRYGVALALESILLFCSVPLLQHTNNLGAYLAAGAFGLQNGMVSTFSGAVLRTTHVSGAFTDFGIFIGQSLRGVGVDRRRIQLCALLILSFLAGAVAGAVGDAQFGYGTLYFPATATGLVGIAYASYRHRAIGGGVGAGK